MIPIIPNAKKIKNALASVSDLQKVHDTNPGIKKLIEYVIKV